MWLYKNSKNKFLDAQGWSASHSGNDCSGHVPIYKDGKVVALVVATGDYDAIEGDVRAIAKEITDACNAAQTAPTCQYPNCGCTTRATCTLNFGPKERRPSAY